MKIAAVAYPKLNDKDFDWIQSIRKEYDSETYQFIKPHFTLLFPLEIDGPKQIIEHVQNVAKDFQAFDFNIRAAIIGSDYKSNKLYTFLVPDGGSSNFIKLHDAIYTDFLEAKLVVKAIYIPHITIASSIDEKIHKKLVADINKTNPNIKGRIESLNVIDITNTEPDKEIANIKLGSR